MTAPTNLLNVGTVLIGFAPVKLPVTVKTYHTARLSAALDNTAPIWLSNKQIVTWTGEHEGYRLDPGQSVDLEVEELGLLFAISTDIEQRLSWTSL